jgi:hypothetical protein
MLKEMSCLKICSKLKMTKSATNVFVLKVTAM